MSETVDIKVICNLVEVYSHYHSGPVIAEIRGVLLDELIKEMLKDERIIKIVKVKDEQV